NDAPARRRRRCARRSPDGHGVCHRGARRVAVVHDRRRRRGRHLLSGLLRRPRAPRRVKADKIYLVGFMGAGTTTVARALAKRLGWRSADVDELIEGREPMTVSEVFARRGEPYFRSVERTVLFDQLVPRHVVVATGGGTFADPQNRAAINGDGVSVWLDVPLDRLTARIPSDGRRPLAADRAGFARLYHQRRSAYGQSDAPLDDGHTT